MFKWNPILIANKPTLYFLYGLSFFLLGFAILVQQRRSSRLKLARLLPWLALFALVHGLAEWGYLFIPLNEPYLSKEAVQGLKVVQVLMWILSFFFLICFGVSFFERRRKIKLALSHLGVLITTTLFFVWLFDHSISFWLTGNGLEIFARYFLCIPGAVLAATGLWQQRGELGSLGSKHLLRYLTLAVISFAGYALAAGLIVPQSSFFLAKILNTTNFNKAVGFPVELLRAGLGITMAFAILNVLRMYNLEDQKRMAENRRRETLAKERARISRDLHDGVIQSIYAVGLVLQKIKRTGAQHSQLTVQLDGVLKSLDEVVTDIRRYIQNLIPQTDGSSLTGSLSELKESLSLPLELIADGKTLARLSPAAAEHIRLIIIEALTNISKHAEASQAAVCFQARSEGLEIEIKDNGIGIPDESQYECSGKYGLKNLKERATALNGSCRISSGQDGTSVRVWIPWEGNTVA